MKKIYLQPAIRVVKIQPQHRVLGYSVNEFTRGGEETVTDDKDW